jgi:hypothetical protein
MSVSAPYGWTLLSDPNDQTKLEMECDTDSDFFLSARLLAGMVTFGIVTKLPGKSSGVKGEMKLRPELIEGLRLLFAEGTTFSGLLRYIIDQHTDKKVTPGVVRQYLTEAFCIRFHESIRMDVHAAENDSSYARVNAFLIPEIVAAYGEWQKEFLPSPGEKPWFDDLRDSAVAPPQEPITRAAPPAGIRTDTWAALPDSDRERICQMEASNRILWEQLQLLARLAEQLQRRLFEFKEKSETAIHHLVPPEDEETNTTK